jgi:hypothetical protein
MVILRRYWWQIYLVGFVLSWPVFLWFETRTIPLAELTWWWQGYGTLWPALIWPLAWVGLLAIAFAQWMHG